MVRAIFLAVRSRFIPSSLNVVSGFVLALIASAIGTIAIGTQGYARLTVERPVAEVTVISLHPALQLYRVTVRRLDVPALTRSCDIQGDEWLMTAAVQKWRPWLNILGLDSTYRLDQLENKYFTAARGNGRLITSCDIGGIEPADALVANGLMKWFMAHVQASDRQFGSAVYMPLSNGAAYRVVMTQSGLNVDAINPTAISAVHQQY